MYYFDMDGVLAIYDWSCYTGERPPYLTKGSHCYRHLAPDDKIISVMKKLNDMKLGVGVLTSVTNMGHLYVEQVGDKMAWLSEQVPWLDLRTQFFPSPGSKRDLIELIRRPKGLVIRTDDVLIDDWNANLNEWAAAGGLALKYCNGLNSPNKENPSASYKGLHLTQDMRAEDIIELLLMITKTGIQPPG